MSNIVRMYENEDKMRVLNEDAANLMHEINYGMNEIVDGVRGISPFDSQVIGPGAYYVAIMWAATAPTTTTTASMPAASPPRNDYLRRQLMRVS